MRFLMFVETAADADPAPTGEGVLDIEEWVSKYEASGHWVMGDRTRPATDATTVRRRGGQLLVATGVPGGADDTIAGFDVLECADLAEAVAIAAEHPMSEGGRLQLRAFWPFDEPEA